MTLDVDVFVVDSPPADVPAGHAPYVVERVGKQPREFACIHESLAYARRCGEGARVMRGRVVLAVTARRYAEVGEADDANRRRAQRRARVAS